MIDYQKILNNNMINVLKDILQNIENNGLSNNNHLYITFLTGHSKTKIPNWIQEKYPEEMTIVIQYEYYGIKINKSNFEITLSFNDIKATLKIHYDSIISFADPSANFGLRLKKNKNEKDIRKIKKIESKKSNIINFSNFKKK